MAKVELAWMKDISGYRLVEYGPRVKLKRDLYAISSATLKVVFPPALTGKVDLETQQYILPKGGQTERYFPLERYDFLFPVFAKLCIDADGVLDFMRKFGPLTAEGMDPQIGEAVESVLLSAEAMRRLLAAHNSNDRSLLLDVLRSELSLESTERAKLKVGLSLDPGTDEVSLTLTAPDLINALWLQCIQFVAGGRALQSCEECGKFFEVGGGKRRVDAKFCSDEHRIRHNSRKR